MKNQLLLLLLLISGNLIGHIPMDSLVGLKAAGVSIAGTDEFESNSIPVVFVTPKTTEDLIVKWVLNGITTTKQKIGAINPMQIDSMTVRFDTLQTVEEQRTGIIYVKTKDDYVLKFISLNDLQKKYINLPDSLPILFILDEEIINANYDVYQVDENFVLKLEVQSISTTQKGLDVYTIKILTKSEENLERPRIIIRGIDPDDFEYIRQ